MNKSQRYRELTPLSIIGGVIVGIVLNVGIVFAGLQIGFTIVGSTVGAILGFGFLRGVLRKGSILEVNIFQTVASSVNTVNAGVIFTVPVLFLLGIQDEINYPALLLATIAGSVLGVVMIIPLRKQIIDFERLRFPSAVGVAAILRSPGAGKRKAQLLMVSILVSMILSGMALDWSTSNPLDLGLFTLDLTGVKGTLIPDKFELGQALHVPAGFRFVFAMSLLSLGAGYLAGRPGLAILYGTILNFWFLIPAAVAMAWVPIEYANFDIWSTAETGYISANRLATDFNHFTSRHVGIGMILGGALAGVFIALPALKAAFSSLKDGSKTGGSRQEEISIRTLGLGLALGFICLFIAAKFSSSSMGWGSALLATFVGGLWLWLAGLVVAQTTGRTDWSPLSGLSVIAVALVMWIVGSSDDGILPAITIGAAICVATSMCADMMADFKTGYLVGGIPRKQQIAQIATCWIGPGIALGTVFVLWQAYAFGPNQAEILFDRASAQGGEVLATFIEKGGSTTTLPSGTPQLGAPQAGALEGAIDIIQHGDVAVGKYMTGAALGMVVSMLVSPGLGVMVGLSLYLPFKYMIVFGLGGLINILVTRMKGARIAEDLGVPIAAGLIVGDALVGVMNAILKVIDAV